MELAIPGQERHGRIFMILWMESILGMWDDGMMRLLLTHITRTLLQMMLHIVRKGGSVTCPPCGRGSVGTTSKVKKLSPDQLSTAFLEVVESSCGSRHIHMRPMTISIQFFVLNSTRWTKEPQYSKLPPGRLTSPCRRVGGWVWMPMASTCPQIGTFDWLVRRN